MKESWRPVPASKPAHLSGQASGNASNTSMSTALQGATSAFATKPITIANNVRQARHASPRSTTISPTSNSPRGRLAAALEDQPRDNDKRSPSRGRHHTAQKTYLAGAKTAASNAASPIQIKGGMPALERSPSAIAARLASSASSSPVRTSPTGSPRRTGTLSRENTDYLQPRNSFSQAATPLSRTTSAADITESPQSVKTMTLDFERLPDLRSPQAIVNQAPKRSALTDLQKSNAPLTNAARSTQGQASETMDPPKQIAFKPAAIPKPQGASKHVSQTSSVPPQPPPARNAPSTRPSTAYAHRPAASPAPPAAPSTSSKPPTPAPRRPNTAAPALKANRTGPLPGETREQAISRMADAMVAGSLASTRLPSTRTPSPSKLHRHGMAFRRPSSTNDLRRLASSFDTHKAAPPPPKPRQQRPMKHTLRKQSSDNEEDDNVAWDPARRGRRHLVRKHPNMHHEGDRKRWRDKVTDLERKRYEGVFAANRGLLLRSADPRLSPSKVVDPNAENNHVVNVVVKDIWERSHLGRETLREIYSLVAPNEPLTLNREQFVVGLWLIDQKLKGRKLPVKVSPSVWASVRHTSGIKIHGGGVG